MLELKTSDGIILIDTLYDNGYRDHAVVEIAGQLRGMDEEGVVFEDYDFPDLKTVNHVCVLGAEKAAWFKDTEGNYLCLHEDLAPGQTA